MFTAVLDALESSSAFHAWTQTQQGPAAAAADRTPGASEAAGPTGSAQGAYSRAAARDCTGTLAEVQRLQRGLGIGLGLDGDGGHAGAESPASGLGMGFGFTRGAASASSALTPVSAYFSAAFSPMSNPGGLFGSATRAHASSVETPPPPPPAASEASRKSHEATELRGGSTELGEFWVEDGQRSGHTQSRTGEEACPLPADLAVHPCFHLSPWELDMQAIGWLMLLLFEGEDLHRGLGQAPPRNAGSGGGAAFRPQEALLLVGAWQDGGCGAGQPSSRRPRCVVCDPVVDGPSADYSLAERLALLPTDIREIAVECLVSALGTPSSSAQQLAATPRAASLSASPLGSSAQAVPHVHGEQQLALRHSARPPPPSAKALLSSERLFPRPVRLAAGMLEKLHVIPNGPRRVVAAAELAAVARGASVGWPKEATWLVAGTCVDAVVCAFQALQQADASAAAGQSPSAPASPTPASPRASPPERGGAGGTVSGLSGIQPQQAQEVGSSLGRRACHLLSWLASSGDAALVLKFVVPTLRSLIDALPLASADAAAALAAPADGSQVIFAQSVDAEPAALLAALLGDPLQQALLGRLGPAGYHAALTPSLLSCTRSSVQPEVAAAAAAALAEAAAAFPLPVTLRRVVRPLVELCGRRAAPVLSCHGRAVSNRYRQATRAPVTHRLASVSRAHLNSRLSPSALGVSLPQPLGRAKPCPECARQRGSVAG